MTKKLLLVTALLFLTLNCTSFASSEKTICMYEGPEKPRNEVAVLVWSQSTMGETIKETLLPRLSDLKIRIWTIDYRQLPVSGLSLPSKANIELLPGEHQLVVSAYSKKYNGTMSPIHFNFEAGKTYGFKVAEVDIEDEKLAMVEIVETEISTETEQKNTGNNQSDILALKISNDGKYLVSGSLDNTIIIRDFATGNVINTLSGHDGGVNCLALSMDGKYIVSGGRDNTIKVWELASGNLIRTLEGHSDWVTSIAVSPNGKYLASSSADRTVKIWDLESGDNVYTSGKYIGWALAVAISPDGRYLAASNADTTLDLRELETGKEVLRFKRGGLYFVWANVQAPIIFEPDGKNLLSNSWEGALLTWDVAKGKSDKYVLLRSYLNAMDITTDGKCLATVSCNGDISIWDWSHKKITTNIKGEMKVCFSTAFSPDGKYLVVGGENTIKILGMPKGTVIRSL